MPPAVEKYQAYLISPLGDIKIGGPTTCEATAWQEVWTEGSICFPTDPEKRRLLEQHCRVERVVPINGT